MPTVSSSLSFDHSCSMSNMNLTMGNWIGKFDESIKVINHSLFSPKDTLLMKSILLISGLKMLRHFTKGVKLILKHCNLLVNGMNTEPIMSVEMSSRIPIYGIYMEKIYLQPVLNTSHIHILSITK